MLPTTILILYLRSEAEVFSRLDDAEPTVAVTRSPNAINARGPGSPSCPSRAGRAVAVSIRKDNVFPAKPAVPARGRSGGGDGSGGRRRRTR